MPLTQPAVEPLGCLVATLSTHALVRARIRDAVDQSVAVVHCASTREALDLVKNPEVTVMVIDAVDGEGASNAAVVAAIRRNAPRVVILAYCSLAPGASAAVLACAQCGATGLVFEGVDDSRFALRSALRTARINSASAALYEELAAFLPPELTPLLRYAVSRAGEEPSVGGAAEKLGVDRKTLGNWLRRYTALGTREFINWLRLALAVGVLETTTRTAEQVALDFGFASGTAFRNMLRRYTGATSATARTDGGARWLIDLFKDRFGQSSADRSGEQRDGAATDRMRGECRTSPRSA